MRFVTLFATAAALTATAALAQTNPPSSTTPPGVDGPTVTPAESQPTTPTTPSATPARHTGRRR
ncbi:hypothetical protein [Sphingomonas sp.]|uniref:hypothetical protein n=1 Tax=Sphingomonas sp. TaxID=28214 RepID=UPI003CC5AE9E